MGSLKEGTEKVPFKLKKLLNLVVDLRSRRFAFRGWSGEPPDMNETVKAPTLN
jgi:hypothetical protein